MLATLVGLGRRTVTGMLHTCGASFRDWSAVYRLFSKVRLDADPLFAVTRRGVLGELDPAAPLLVAMDDSLLPKRGPKIPGVAWRRDPLGPPFHTNFIRAQRVLGISAVLGADERGPARAIPIDYQHAPTPRRPRNFHNASDEVRKQYRQACRKDSMAAQGARRLQVLREQLDQDSGSAGRALEVVVDGRFTNRVVLRQLPPNTVLIGRLRKDAKLYQLPAPPPAGARGRGRLYGERAATPEQLRRDDNVEWQIVEAWAAGKLHRFRVKTLSPLRWRPAGGQRNLRLVVIAPLAYRPRPGAKLLYRQPAYLIVSDPQLPLARIVQHYVRRWDIEVNFRDEKTLLGVGEAQVRHPRSVGELPRMIVAAYSWLLLAARRGAEVAGGQQEAAGDDAGSAAATARRAMGRRPAAFLQLSLRRRHRHEAPRNSSSRFPKPCYMLAVSVFTAHHPPAHSRKGQTRERGLPSAPLSGRAHLCETRDGLFIGIARLQRIQRDGRLLCNQHPEPGAYMRTRLYAAGRGW